MQQINSQGCKFQHRVDILSSRSNCVAPSVRLTECRSSSCRSTTSTGRKRSVRIGQIGFRGGASPVFSSPSRARAWRVEPKQASSLSHLTIEPTSSLTAKKFWFSQYNSVTNKAHPKTLFDGKAVFLQNFAQILDFKLQAWVRIQKKLSQASPKSARASPSFPLL